MLERIKASIDKNRNWYKVKQKYCKCGAEINNRKKYCVECGDSKRNENTRNWNKKKNKGAL